MIFRVTPRQQQELKCREFLCGRTLQDYMLQSAMTQQVIVAGDRALLERVESKLNELEPLLQKMEEGEAVDQPVLEELRTVYEMTMEWK